jgi:hypothetical protein
VTVAAAHDALAEAVATREAARDRALAEVDRQFAPIIARRQQELSEALARQQERQQA